MSLPETSNSVAAVIAKGGTLLDAAQAYWLERFLSAPSIEVSVGGHQENQTRRLLDPEVYFWAAPCTKTDGHPNLAACRWPG